MAFARTHGEDALVCAVPRLTLRMLEDGGLSRHLGGTVIVLPDALGRFGLPRVLFTGRVFRPKMRDGSFALDLGELFSIFPVALLSRTNG